MSQVITAECQKALQELASELHKAKAMEASAKEYRTEIETKIANLVETKKKGQRTVKVPGWNVTVKRSLLYKADCDALKRLMIEGEEYYAPIESKNIVSLDEKGYEWYREKKPTIFAEICKHVKVKPAKTSVNVKAVT
jgi:hypothetical protein